MVDYRLWKASVPALVVVIGWAIIKEWRHGESRRRDCRIATASSQVRRSTAPKRTEQSHQERTTGEGDEQESDDEAKCEFFHSTFSL